MTQRYYILDNEHPAHNGPAYWLARGHGLTTDARKAHAYSKRDAEDIVHGANGSAKRFRLIPVPADDDIVKRLREAYSDIDSSGHALLGLEAADEIERVRELGLDAIDREAALDHELKAVRAELARYREALSRIVGILDVPPGYVTGVRAALEVARESLGEPSDERR